MKDLKGILYIILSGVCFGIIPILAKLAYKGGASTFTVLSLRFTFASIMLLYYIINNKISIKVSKKQFIILLLLGAVGFAGTSITLFWSYKYISAGLATNILFTHPAIVTVLSAFIYKEKLYFKKIMSLALSILGVFVLVGFKDVNFNMTGVLFASISSLIYSFYVLGASIKEIKKLDSYVTSFYISMFCGIIMILSGISTDSLNFNMNFYSLICIILLAFISTVVALKTFMSGIKLIGPSRSSILSTIEPIVSLVLGCIILKEAINLQIIVGSVMIILSILLLAKED